jgi:hypothetical protein
MSKFTKQLKRLRARFECNWPHCTCKGIDVCAAKAEKLGKAGDCAITRVYSRPRSEAEIQAEQDRRSDMHAEVNFEVSRQNTSAIYPEGQTTPTKWWSSKTQASCYHPGLKRISRIGETDLFIAADIDMVGLQDIALVVQCFASTWTRDDASNPILPAKYASLAAHTLHVPDRIILPWRDGGIPSLKPTFWSELIRLFPPGKVVFVCQGGHGRSGTALAATLMVHFKGSARWAIGLVRNQHCDEAIETKVQLEYLESLEAWVKSNDPTPTALV